MLSELLRPLALNRQGLGPSPAFGQGVAGALRAIEHLGYVQIDTLSVIERAHHHVLWTRVPGYAPGHLNTLLREGRVFEHWFHAASCLPMRDVRFSLPLMAAVREGRTWHAGRADAAVMRQLLDRVRVDGPLTLRRLGHPSGMKGAQGGWWNAGPLKHALDRLFMQGDLMVRERQGIVETRAQRLRQFRHLADTNARCCRSRRPSPSTSARSRNDSSAPRAPAART